MGLKNYLFGTQLEREQRMANATLEENVLDEKILSKAKKILGDFYNQKRIAQYTLPNIAHVANLSFFALGGSLEDYITATTFIEVMRGSVYFTFTKKKLKQQLDYRINEARLEENMNEVINHIDSTRKTALENKKKIEQWLRGLDRPDDCSGYDGWLKPPR